jgi:site-specific recombinase XerD
VDAAIKRIAKKVGIEKNVSFHTARHTFATLVQAVTRDIETTKKMLGHRSLKSTMVYAEVLTEEKVKAVENTKTVFHSCKPKVENKKIPKTKRTAATNRHPRKVTE